MVEGAIVEDDSVVTAIATEKDKACQTFLAGLHPSCRPNHVLRNLSEHITEECHRELDSARDALFAEMEWFIRSVCCSKRCIYCLI